MDSERNFKRDVGLHVPRSIFWCHSGPFSDDTCQRNLDFMSGSVFVNIEFLVATWAKVSTDVLLNMGLAICAFASRHYIWDTGRRKGKSWDFPCSSLLFVAELVQDANFDLADQFSPVERSWNHSPTHFVPKVRSHNRFSKVSIDFLGFPQVSAGFQGFPKAFPRVSKGFQ